MAQLVLLDNTILTNLALVRRSHLILELWPEAAATIAVRAEYEAGIATESLPADGWPDLPIFELTAEERELEAGLPPRLGPGESSSLAVAKQRGGILASDDRQARQTARALQVPTTGTIGALLRGVEMDVLTVDEGSRLLKQMITEGYRSPSADLTVFLP